MAWKKFFILKSGAPHVFIYGDRKLRLTNPKYPVRILLKAYLDGCPYLALTERGREKFAEQIGRVALPNRLPADIGKRNILLLSGDNLEDELESGAGDGALTPEQVVALALEKGLITRKGNTYLFGQRKAGTKAILSRDDIIEELRALV